MKFTKAFGWIFIICSLISFGVIGITEGIGWGILYPSTLLIAGAILAK